MFDYKQQMKEDNRRLVSNVAPLIPLANQEIELVTEIESLQMKRNEFREQIQKHENAKNDYPELSQMFEEKISVAQTEIDNINSRIKDIESKLEPIRAEISEYMEYLVYLNDLSMGDSWGHRKPYVLKRDDHEEDPIFNELLFTSSVIGNRYSESEYPKNTSLTYKAYRMLTDRIANIFISR